MVERETLKEAIPHHFKRETVTPVVGLLHCDTLAASGMVQALHIDAFTPLLSAAFACLAPGPFLHPVRLSPVGLH
jgi:hypothetical protein